MKTEYHSIWLMPCATQERMLSGIVRDLAGRFESPIFQPHLTLVEDMPRTCEELQPLLAQVAEDASAFDAPVETVEESGLYYRSFYARFPVVQPLRVMKTKAVEVFRVGNVESFMPHISLAYGVQEGPEKSRSMGDLRERLAGMSVRFDRICIVSSSQQTPIEEWAIRSSVPLPE
ncbi:haloacid dehalogenase [Microvirga sp. TS319]|uniref:haloacid dehalogenase n=1 Tax=Microvirga sp. TS319 TaxID=3241165 RepID=UPI00351A2B00